MVHGGNPIRISGIPLLCNPVKYSSILLRMALYFLLLLYVVLKVETINLLPAQYLLVAVPNGI